MSSTGSVAHTVFGKRLRYAREVRGLPQDKLGVMIGLDESCASARMSRYERGVHEPPIATARLIASALDVPLAYLYCEDDVVAELLWLWQQLPGQSKSKLSKEWIGQAAELLLTSS